MSCAEPLSIELLIDYFAGDLADADSERVDLHLLSCEDCSTEAGRLAPLMTALRHHIPYVVTARGLRALERRHLRVAKSEVPAGARAFVPFPDDADLLVIKLRAPLDQVARLDCELCLLDGRPLLSLPEVPFDAREGSVQLACQRHFLERFGPEEFKVSLYRADDQQRRVLLAEYMLRHV